MIQKDASLNFNCPTFNSFFTRDASSHNTLLYFIHVYSTNLNLLGLNFMFLKYTVTRTAKDLPVSPEYCVPHSSFASFMCTHTYITFSVPLVEIHRLVSLTKIPMLLRKWKAALTPYLIRTLNILSKWVMFLGFHVSLSG